MSDSQTNFVLTNPLPKHFAAIQDLCRKVYPFSKPWSIHQLESHRSYFPDGQLIVVDENTGQVIGLAFSLIISWNDYSPQDNWQDFTSSGFFHNHNPKVGTTLYGAEVMVDPEYRGRGIGKMLYDGRRAIVEKYGLKRIRAGARLRGYAKFKDKLTPHEYVKQVVAGQIYDPTLSFQLGREFKVIDVAPNYLFNDPESLGYAAVIEWLNPKECSERDFEKQRQRIELFMSGDKFAPEFLPRELRRLVRKATTVLGQAILEIEGEKFYRRVESYRERLKRSRIKSLKAQQLKSIWKELAHESADDLLKLAHAFSLQLEIVNACEAAYRTWRQRQKPSPQGIKTKLNLTYVLTAHPTEARFKGTIEVLDALQTMLVDGIHNNFLFNDAALITQMRLLWLQPLAKRQKPSVLDEAEYIYSIIFAPDIVDFVLTEKPGYDLRLRTWVGGDKDGHPGVNKDVMRQCLTASRRHILDHATRKLNRVLADLINLAHVDRPYRNDIDAIKALLSALKPLHIINNGDGTRVKVWKTKFKSYLKKAGPVVKRHEQILLLSRICDLFPAFVLPLELREDAQLIEAALKDTKSPIREMLAELGRISGALSVTFYARGLVISHCESDGDLANACRLVDTVFRSATLPVIPLFETGEALRAGRGILKKWLKVKRNHDRVIRHWGKKLEVMLGYSDSAKQTGVLPSRLLIARAMQDIDRTLKNAGIRTVFFHGSGGSVARGGGSLKEQISWWSQAAIEHPKMTVQGEMIQRLFASKEILNSQCAHLTTEALRRKVRKFKMESSPALDKFASAVHQSYNALVGDPKLLGRLLDATPYRYLEVLKIGSRPSKRPSTDVSVASLRAIPWVLCWTQARVLLPTWWGVGSAWTSCSKEEQASLKDLFSRDPFFSSFVKTLGFTLTKVELDVWAWYFSDRKDEEMLKMVRAEFDRAARFVFEVSGEKQLLWHRPWLEESIRLRAAQIHILNLIQIRAMKREDESLLLETIVGIACGMLTTG